MQRFNPNKPARCNEHTRVIPPEKGVPVIPGEAMEHPEGWTSRDSIEFLKSVKRQTADMLEEIMGDETRGNVLTDRGFIGFERGSGAGIIPGIAFSFGDENGDGACAAETAVALTRTSGFHYVTTDRNGAYRSLGAVDTPVIVGDAYNPSAILIPFNSVEAMVDGREFIDSMIEGPAPSYDDVVAITPPQPVIEEDMCKCGRHRNKKRR